MPRSLKLSFARLASLFALVAVAGCGEDSATAPKASSDGGWTGVTSQGKAFHLLVEESGVVFAAIGFTVIGTTCTDDVTAYIGREPPDAPFAVAGGSFTIATTGTRGTITAAGTLEESGSAAGTLNVSATTCNGNLATTWTATRATSAQVSLTGTWTGTLRSSLVPSDDGSFTISQSGSTLTGTWSTGGGGGGTVSGTVMGRMVTVTLKQTVSGCPGTFKGHGYVQASPEVLVFNYSGTDCLGTHQYGSLNGVRS